jgi:putative phosphoribosyl transferase
LLTPEEDLSYRSRFDIDLLTVRLVRALVWLRARPEVRDATIGLFGVSTGAAAALKIAARNTDIAAVVTRGGRPDLAGSELHFVRLPTLLIAGGRDYDVLRLNRQAMNEMNCRKELAVVAQATHQFDEPGALEMVARLTVRWFENYLKAASPGHHERAQIAAVG